MPESWRRYQEQMFNDAMLEHAILKIDMWEKAAKKAKEIRKQAKYIYDNAILLDNQRQMYLEFLAQQIQEYVEKIMEILEG